MLRMYLRMVVSFRSQVQMGWWSLVPQNIRYWYQSMSMYLEQDSSTRGRIQAYGQRGDIHDPFSYFSRCYWMLWKIQARKVTRCPSKRWASLSFERSLFKALVGSTRTGEQMSFLGNPWKQWLKVIPIRLFWQTVLMTLRAKGPTKSSLPYSGTTISPSGQCSLTASQKYLIPWVWSSPRTKTYWSGRYPRSYMQALILQSVLSVEAWSTMTRWQLPYFWLRTEPKLKAQRQPWPLLWVDITTHMRSSSMAALIRKRESSRASSASMALLMYLFSRVSIWGEWKWL